MCCCQKVLLKEDLETATSASALYALYSILILYLVQKASLLPKSFVYIPP